MRDKDLYATHLGIRLFTLYYQNAVVDSAALQGVALSNAMAGTTP